MNLVFQIFVLTLIFSNHLKLSSTAENVTLNNKGDLLEETTEVITQNISLEEKYEEMEKSVKNVVRMVIKTVLPRIMEGSTTINISMTCIRDAMKLIAGIKDIRTWAMKFLDASGKSFDGLLTGKMASFGSYDECINTEAINERKGKNYGEVMFRGQYCALDIKPPLPPKTRFHKIEEVVKELKNFSTRGTVVAESAKNVHFFHFIPLRIGICVPTGCSEDDVREGLKQVASMSSGTVALKRCEIKEDNHFTPLMIGVICLFSFAGLLVLIATLIDIYIYYSEEKFDSLLVRILLCFSFILNFKKLFNTDTASETMSCLNGIRFLSMAWIVLGHTYLIVNFQLFSELQTVTAFSKDFAFQAIVNATVAVDTFFFMGGMLVCYLTIKITKETKKPFNIPLYIVHRIWRLVPVYAFVIAFMFLLPLLGSGPIFHDTIDEYLDSCYRNWWVNFLFINNYYEPIDMCVPQSWYVASDMQLYICALIVLLPMIRWPKVGITISVLGILASVISSGVLTYVNDFPPTMLFVHPDPEERISYWSSYYFKAYPHAAPYCIGIITGYFLATRSSIRIPKVFLTVGWCCAIICNMSVLYGVLEWNKGIEPSLWERIIYSSCHRVGWALGIVWVIICCSYGYGGVVNYILSWKVWIPLGRLTYITYLIHPIVQIVVVGSFNGSVKPLHYFAVWMFLGNLMVTYSIAFAVCMLVEAPFLSLEKILIPRDKGHPVEKPTKNNIQMKKGLKQENGELITILNISKICNNEEGIGNNGFVYKL